MFFGKDNLGKSLEDEGNLFEIPLFVTYMKYAEAYPRTKRLATDEDYKKVVSNTEDRPWKTDPTTMVDYVYREADMPRLMNGQFDDKMDKLGEMILSAKMSSSTSARHTAQQNGA
ncbi:hypothetical protein DD237_000801 [Peronospora effusa]|uniref:Uncharacterized protein n=1 Tax=Peronospora effusa TaxID=542832 RepID=A0A3R7Y3T2_9STRA|nr:hypothetical protein DD237_000801 [Peronospora effusa]